MIIEFNTSTLEVIVAVAGSDTNTFNAYDLVKPAGYSVQIIADDADVLTNVSSLFKFLAVVSGPTLTGVIRKYVVTLSVSPNPTNMNQQPTVSVQLKDQLGANVSQVQTVTMSVDLGTLDDATLVTNGSGFASTTYKPFKGTQATITATLATFLPGQDVVAINIPTTPAQQNWLESNDIKPAAVGVTQIAPGVLSSRSPQPSFGFIQNAYVRDTIVTALAQDANSIVADDDAYIFVNGFDGPGAANPIIQRINRRTGVTAGSLSGALQEDYANGRDGMVYDGKSLWVSAAGRLYQIDAITMSLTNNYVMVATGKLEALAWNGQYLYAFVRGGATAYKDTIIQIDPATGSIVTNTPTFNSGVYVKQLAFDSAWIYVQVDEAGIAAWARFNYALGVGQASATLAQYNGGVAVLMDDNVFVGGTDGLAKIDVVADVINASLGNATIGDVYDLLFDGTNVWAITGVAGGGGPRRFVRKVSYDGGSTLAIVQSFDFTPQVPQSLSFDGQNLYVLHNDNGNVVKVFVGR